MPSYPKPPPLNPKTMIYPTPPSRHECAPLKTSPPPRIPRFLKYLPCRSCLSRSQPSQSPLRTKSTPLAPLLPPVHKDHVGRKCLVLDLDETLVHSSFKWIPKPDFILPVQIANDRTTYVYVKKRPGLDEFLTTLAATFEIVVFTASVRQYANPVIDMMGHSVHHRLFRDACVVLGRGVFVKNLDLLGRDLTATIIVDNSPASYAMHPLNAIPIKSWFSDLDDRELLRLIPVLLDLATVDNVRNVLGGNLVGSC